jgi:hypothetical protein
LTGDFSEEPGQLPGIEEEPDAQWRFPRSEALKERPMHSSYRSMQYCLWRPFMIEVEGGTTP